MKCPFCHNTTSREAKLCVHCGKNTNQRTANREKSIKCPTCLTPARIILLAGVEIDFCHTCGGLWFDKREMQQFQENLSERNHFDQIIPTLQSIESTNLAPERNVYIDCPVCSNPMIHKNYAELSGIILDQCAQHGTWAEREDMVRVFDLLVSGDLEDLQARVSQKKYLDLERRIRQLNTEQNRMKNQIQRNQRLSRGHFVLDALGFL